MHRNQQHRHEDLLTPLLLNALQSIQWSVVEKVHCLALQTAAVTSTALLVMYWSVLAEAAVFGPFPAGYLNHAANVAIMLLDVWFSKVPFASYHLQVSVHTADLRKHAATCKAF